MYAHYPKQNQSFEANQIQDKIDQSEVFSLQSFNRHESTSKTSIQFENIKHVFNPTSDSKL